MKKTYNNPEINVSRFSMENIVTDSTTDTVLNQMRTEGNTMTIDGKTSIDNIVSFTL